jgi:hypothetical protein
MKLANGRSACRENFCLNGGKSTLFPMPCCAYGRRILGNGFLIIR